ncbi:MAG: fused MFS/spermidine synthase [Verrucomicrobiae bacterium]|nr:fused MFS/spermidine synthase [Verrucomicrobiae bacterium]
MHSKPSTIQAAVSPGLKFYLYLTATICGAAILIVEILGAKMLAPFFGTSHFVWTAQIGVTLVSLAVGYYFGGKLADRKPQASVLYFLILFAAVYLCLTIPLCRSVAYRFLSFKLAAGSLLASMFLFFVPLMLLAMVYPFIVRILTSSVQVVGGQVGRLSALSTIGSVAGTLLIGYILIPYLPNSMIMFFTAVMLMLVVAVYFVRFHPKGGILTSAALVIFGGLMIGYGGIRAESSLEYDGLEELERRNSNFGLMQVLQSSNSFKRYYLNDFLTQNIYDPSRKKSLALFTYALEYLAEGYTGKIEDVLCIGLGVGIVPMEFAKKGARVDVVEINPFVVPMAKKHFDLEPERMNITICDGRYFLNQSKKQYDAIILDAFLGDSSPSHMMTKEAFLSMKRLLKPSGTLVINSFGDLEKGRDFFTASLQETLKSVFKSVRIHTAHTGNIFFAVSDKEDMKFVTKPDLSDVHPSLQYAVEMVLDTVVEANPEHGRVLTDDFNPVEFYDAKNRERMRRWLAEFMKPS